MKHLIVCLISLIAAAQGATGTPEFDPVTAQLRTLFEDGTVPPIEQFDSMKTWYCWNHSTSANTYSNSRMYELGFESAGGMLFLKHSGGTFMYALGGYVRTERRGAYTGYTYIRVTPANELVFEICNNKDPIQVPSLVHENFHVTHYVICK